MADVVWNKKKIEPENDLSSKVQWSVPERGGEPKKYLGEFLKENVMKAVSALAGGGATPGSPLAGQLLEGAGKTVFSAPARMATNIPMKLLGEDVDITQMEGRPRGGEVPLHTGTPAGTLGTMPGRDITDTVLEILGPGVVTGGLRSLLRAPLPFAEKSEALLPKNFQPQYPDAIRKTTVKLEGLQPGPEAQKVLTAGSREGLPSTLPGQSVFHARPTTTSPSGALAEEAGSSSPNVDRMLGDLKGQYLSGEVAGDPKRAAEMMNRDLENRIREWILGTRSQEAKAEGGIAQAGEKAEEGLSHKLDMIEAQIRSALTPEDRQMLTLSDRTRRQGLAPTGLPGPKGLARRVELSPEVRRLSKLWEETRTGGRPPEWHENFVWKAERNAPGPPKLTADQTINYRRSLLTSIREESQRWTPEQLKDVNEELRRVELHLGVDGSRFERFSESVSELAKDALSQPEWQKPWGTSPFWTQLRAAPHFLEAHSPQGAAVARPLVWAQQVGNQFEHQYMTTLQNIMSKYSLLTPKSAALSKAAKTAKEADRIAVTQYLNGAMPRDARIKAAGDELRSQFLNPLLELVKRDPELRDLIGPVGYLRDYFPQIHDATTRRLAQIQGIYEATPMAEKFNPAEIAKDMLPDKFKATFLRSRIRDDPSFNNDLLAVMETYLRAIRKTKFDVPAFVESLKARTALYQSMIKKVLPEGLMTPEARAKELGDAERVYLLAKDYGDLYIGQPSATRFASFGPEAKAMTTLVYRGLLGANPKVAWRNLTQNANTIVETGLRNYVRGFTRLLVDKRYSDIVDKMGIVLDYPLLQKDLAKVGEWTDPILLSLFNKAESINRFAAAAAGLEQGMKMGLKGDALMRHALGVVDKTQFVYGRGAPIMALRKSYPVAGQFFQYPMKQAEFIIDVFHNPAKLARFMTLGALSVGSQAAGAAAFGGSDFQANLKNVAAKLWYSLQYAVPSSGVALNVIQEMGGGLIRGAGPFIGWALEYVMNGTDNHKLKTQWQNILKKQVLSRIPMVRQVEETRKIIRGEKTIPDIILGNKGRGK